MGLVKTTEIMTIKDFMNGNFHQDAFGAAVAISVTMAAPAYFAMKFLPMAALVAYKIAIPVVIAL